MTALIPLPKRVPFWLSPERRRSALLTVALHLAAGLGLMLVPEEKIVDMPPSVCHAQRRRHAARGHFY